MTVSGVCVMLALFIVFLVITGVLIMLDEFRNLDAYKENLKFLVKDTTPLGNSPYEDSLKAEALKLLGINAEQVAKGTKTFWDGRKHHRSICIEYFVFGDDREKIMCTYDSLVQQHKNK